jgi:hypothetical protein
VRRDHRAHGGGVIHVFKAAIDPTIMLEKPLLNNHYGTVIIEQSLLNSHF